MNVDFLHNQIIRDTISDKFIESFNENLVPALLAEYGSLLKEVQFYEDHLTSGFRVNGEFFYPLTLVTDGAPFTRWIKWKVANYRNYNNFNPYTYKGKALLDFEIVDDVPTALVDKMVGKAIYAPAGTMPIILTVPNPDKTFLAGKYSQSFVDELSRAITALIEDELEIGGLSESGVVLELAFLPGTFMEHAIENTVYRRMLIKARGCNARDLWIKWTRLDGEGTYSFTDDVVAGEIEFAFGEDVPGKIREKEYRYLATESVDKYQAAMSRKNITEWRDMMRRVVRRGEVESFAEPTPEKKRKPVVEEIVEPTPAPVEEPEIEVAVVAEPEVEVVEAVEEPEIEVELEVEIGEDEAEEEAETEEAEAEEEENSESLLDEDLVAMLTERLDKVEEAEEAHEIDSDLADLLKSAIGIVAETAEKGGEEALMAEAAEEAAETEEVEAAVEAEPEAEAEADDEAEAEEEAAVEEPIEEPVTAAAVTSVPVIDPAALEQKLRAELEAQIRAELEVEMRLKADEAAELRNRLEAQQRQETREKELMAQAALAAIEAQQKLAKQREEEERERAIEEARRAEEEKRAAEEARIQAEREAEAARIKAEEEARAKAEEEARIQAEKEAKEAEEKALMGDSVYVSKTVRLFFRNNIDSSITKRIHEIILATIKYFHKEDVYIRIKATVPDSNTVNLQFVQSPEEELQLLVNIVKVLGRSELGITKATVD